MPRQTLRVGRPATSVRLLTTLAATAAVVTPPGVPAVRAADLNVDAANSNSPFTSTATVTYDTVRVAVSSTGTLSQNSGTLTANTALVVAANTNSIGTYTLGGTAVLNVLGAATVGQSGNGTFNQNAGMATFTGGLTLSGAGNGRGTYNLNGGTLATSLIRGNINGGTNAAFYFNGGTLRPSVGNSTFFQGLSAAYIRNGAATIDTNGLNVVVAQALLHSNVNGDNAKDGGVTKTGTGTLTLSGTSTYTGDTKVFGGTLEVTGKIGIPYQFGITQQSFFRVNATTAPITNLSGSGSITSYLSVIGDNDKGVFNQTGGTHSIFDTFSVGRSDLFDNSASSGTYNLSGGTLTTPGFANVGDGGKGTFTQTGGTFNAGPLRVGYAPNAQNVGNGTYTLGGTGVLSTGATLVGAGASANVVGTFTQTAGTHSTNQLLVGAGGSGSYSLSGTGQLTANALATIGDSTAGSFSQSGGTFNALGLVLGNAAANSSFTLSGGQLQVVKNTVADSGNESVRFGTFTQTGGTHGIGATLGIGNGVGATAASIYGVYALSSGSLTSAQTVVGDGGRGTLNQTGGSHTTSNLTVGIGGSGVYALGGTGTLTVNGDAQIGSTSAGSFAQTAGTNKINGTLYLGFPGQGASATTGQGTFNLSGGTLTTNETQVANLGGGTFTQSGGTHATPQVLIGLNSATGVYNLSNAGVLTISGPLAVGYSGPGTFNQTGGTVTTTGATFLFAATGGSGTYNLNGGTITTPIVVGNSNGGMNAVFNFNGGTLKAGAASTNFLQSLSAANVRNNGLLFDSNGFAATINQPLLHSTIGGDAAIDGGMTKGGAGTLTLTGVNSFTGNTTVTGGTLAITAGSIGVPNTTATFTVDGTSAAAATASLGGTGFIADNAVYVGRGGTGTFSQSGGTHQVTTILYLGYAGTAATTGNGTYNLNSGTLTTAETQVGNTGTGTFNQTAGTLTTPRLFVGLTNGTGTYSLSGTGQLNTTNFVVVGLGGPGTFNQSGGTTNFAGGLFLSGGTGGTGTYNLNGGTLAAQYVTGTKNGGTNATFNFNGGTLRPTAADPDYFEGFTAANVRNGGALIDTNGINTGINQLLRHSMIGGDAATDGGLTKLGAGTLTLTAANTYTGATTVSRGTLQVKYTATAASAAGPLLGGPSGANINSRLVFDYTGSTSPAATVRSLLAASFSAATTPGVMESGQLRSSTATLARGLGYVDDGAGKVTVLATLFGDADLDGGVSINDFNALAGNFGQASGKVWSDGDFDYDGGVSINDFNLLAAGFGQSLPASSETWAGLFAFAVAHNDLAAFETVTGVPEPASLMPMALGALAVARRRKRRLI